MTSAPAADPDANADTYASACPITCAGAAEPTESGETAATDAANAATEADTATPTTPTATTTGSLGCIDRHTTEH